MYDKTNIMKHQASCRTKNERCEKYTRIKQRQWIKNWFISFRQKCALNKVQNQFNCFALWDQFELPIYTTDIFIRQKIDMCVFVLCVTEIFYFSVFNNLFLFFWRYFLFLYFFSKHIQFDMCFPLITNSSRIVCMFLSM